LNKLPDLLTSVEKIRLPDCTYQLVVNVSMGYDPIVLRQIERLQIRIINDDDHFSERRRDYLMPFNIVRYIHVPSCIFLILSSDPMHAVHGEAVHTHTVQYT